MTVKYLPISLENYNYLKRSLITRIKAGEKELLPFLKSIPDWELLPSLTHQDISRKAGQSRSEAKIQAARETAKIRPQRGGRPKTLATIRDWNIDQIMEQLIKDGFQGHDVELTIVAQTIMKIRDKSMQLKWTKNEFISDEAVIVFKQKYKGAELPCDFPLNRSWTLQSSNKKLIEGKLIEVDNDN